jgi:hypothetical protein
MGYQPSYLQQASHNRTQPWWYKHKSKMTCAILLKM